jgi:hypothetical protein
MVGTVCTLTFKFTFTTFTLVVGTSEAFVVLDVAILFVVTVGVLSVVKSILVDAIGGLGSAGSKPDAGLRVVYRFGIVGEGNLRTSVYGLGTSDEGVLVCIRVYRLGIVVGRDGDLGAGVYSFGIVGNGHLGVLGGILGRGHRESESRCDGSGSENECDGKFDLNHVEY